MKKYLIYLFIIIWLVVIFIFSAMSSDESNTSSIDTIKNVTNFTLKITNKINVTNIDITDSFLDNVAVKLNYPLRKIMHMSVYFILTLLALFMFSKNGLIGLDGIVCAMILCVIVAMWDEIHQIFTGRSGMYKDVFIDSIGGIIACLIYTLGINWKNKKSIN
ncbi:MAG: VanZ family protein [Bacilli bacterium]|nr:VanZ family protein [Bacilli bacterium]